MIKNSPAEQETQVPSLGWEDPLEEGMATHSSILAWRIQQRRCWLQPVVSQRVGHNSETEHAHTSPFIKSYKSLLKQGLCLTFPGFLGNIHTTVLHAIGT